MIRQCVDRPHYVCAFLEDLCHEEHPCEQLVFLVVHHERTVFLMERVQGISKTAQVAIFSIHLHAVLDNYDLSDHAIQISASLWTERLDHTWHHRYYDR